MPLVFTPRPMSTIHKYGWLSLDYSEAKNLLIWRGTTEAGPFLDVRDQVHFLVNKFHAFAYNDNAVLDRDNKVEELKAKGIVPDFSQEHCELGWISPKGEFLACDEGNHANLLVLTFRGATSREKIGRGWILIHHNTAQPVDYNTPLTKKQVHMLIRLGFNQSLQRQRIPSFDEDPLFARQRHDIVGKASLTAPLRSISAKEVRDAIAEAYPESFAESEPVQSI